MGYNDILNLRLPRRVRAQYLRLTQQAEHRGRDIADLFRMALEDYADAWEKKLKLHPLTPEEFEELQGILAERKRGPAAPPRPEPNVHYGKRSKSKARKTSRPSSEHPHLEN